MISNSTDHAVTPFFPESRSQRVDVWRKDTGLTFWQSIEIIEFATLRPKRDWYLVTWFFVSISLQTSERVPRLCAQLLPHVRALAKGRPSFPVISWQEFVKKVKEINKTADEEGARNVAFYLNESAEVREKISTNNDSKQHLYLQYIQSNLGF